MSSIGTTGLCHGRKLAHYDEEIGAHWTFTHPTAVVIQLQPCQTAAGSHCLRQRQL